MPASDCASLTALPATARAVVDEDRFGELTAYDTRREVYGAGRRAILTHSPELHDKQARGFTGTTLAKAGRKEPGPSRPPPWPAARPTATPEGRSRDRQNPARHLGAPRHRLAAGRRYPKGPPPHLAHRPRRPRRPGRRDLRQYVLITDHDDWPAAEVIAAYRSQSEAESSFRQMKDARVASFSPMFHWTEHNIRVHMFTCVLALQLAHHAPPRRPGRAGPAPGCVPLAELARIGETVLLYPGDRGLPRAHRMLTDTTPVQDKLIKIFGLDRYAPRR